MSGNVEFQAYPGRIIYLACRSAEKLDVVDGDIEEIDMTDLTACLIDNVGWVPIRALVGFETASMQEDIAKQRSQVNDEHTAFANVVGTSDTCLLKAKTKNRPNQRHEG